MSAQALAAVEPATDKLARLMPDLVDDAIQLMDDAGLEKLAMYAGPLAAYVENAKALAKAAPKDDAEEARVVGVLTDGRMALTDLESLRKALVAPRNEEVKSINAIFRRVTQEVEALTEKRGPLERVVLAYREAKRARIQREEAEALRKQEAAALAEAEALAKAERARTEPARQAALAAAEAASTAQAQALVEAPRPMNRGTRTETGSVSARQTWTFEVVDPGSVPRQYLTPDVKAIAAAVKAGVRTIAGVNIHPEETLTVRAGR